MPRPVCLFTGQWADLSLADLAAKAKTFGYEGLELACWGDHFDVGACLDDAGYAQRHWELLGAQGLASYAISTHLVGQAVADPIDERHRSILPPEIWGDGDPEGVRTRAAEEMKRTAQAARVFFDAAPAAVRERLEASGRRVVNGFTGSPIWHLLYSFPPVSPEQIQAGFEEFASRWTPILDAFAEEGVAFALEVHPTEIAFDLATTRRALAAVNDHPAFGFNFDPSHLGYQGVDYLAFLREFGPRVFNVHVKDVWWSDVPTRIGVFGGHADFGEDGRFWDFRSPGRGRVDFEGIVRLLNHADYRGPLTVEWEDPMMDREAGATEAGGLRPTPGLRPLRGRLRRGLRGVACDPSPPPPPEEAPMVAETAAPRMSAQLSTRLSVMMFLQYAIWGAWLPFLWSFLADHRGMGGDQIGHMFAAGAVGAIIGPFLAGQVADRHFATERVLGISHLVGAVLIWQLAWIESYWLFLVFSLVYGLVYAPTLSLTNSLAFHHMPDRDRDFGRVRVWGTFGWILVGLMMGHWLALRHTPEGLDDAAVLASQVAGKADAFRLSSILGLLMGVYCFTLPNTPPSPGQQKNATFEALGSIRVQPLLTLFLLAVPVSCIHQFYFVHTEAYLGNRQLAAPAFFKTVFGAGGGGLMTIGQMSEVLVLAAIPLVAKTMARKWLLALGLVAYGLRMFLFAYVDTLGLPVMPTLLAGVALHGLCFGCFIFVAFMVVDEESPGDVRASAQSLFNLVIIGIGIIVGSTVAGAVADWATGPKLDAAGAAVLDAQGVAVTAIDYQQMFSVPMWASLACLVALLVAYPARRPKAVV